MTTKEIADRFKAVIERKNYEYDLRIVAGVYVFKFKEGAIAA